MAARIGALAGAGEILGSRDTLRRRRLERSALRARAAELKGFEEPVELVGVDWR